jgi:hypothetical protein
LEQFLPALGQTPPKLPIAFVDSPRRLGVTFLNLVLKEIAWFEHYRHRNKMPRLIGAFKGSNAVRRCLFRYPPQEALVRGAD